MGHPRDARYSCVSHPELKLRDGAPGGALRCVHDVLEYDIVDEVDVAVGVEVECDAVGCNEVVGDPVVHVLNGAKSTRSQRPLLLASPGRYS